VLPRFFGGGFVISGGRVVVETVISAFVDVTFVWHPGLRQGSVERRPSAANWLKSHPDSTGKLGAVGFCFGGGIVPNRHDWDALLNRHDRHQSYREIRNLFASPTTYSN
jgi:hypothetical protein